MATSVSPGSTQVELASVDVFVPDGFPHEEIRQRLERGGVSIGCWGDASTVTAGSPPSGGGDLLILGVRRPNRTSLEIVEAVGRDGSPREAVLICERAGDGDVRRALDAGARAVIPLDRAAEALLPVIGAVRAGQVCVPDGARRELGRKVLTAREKQILAQVVLGMTNAEIAAKLYLAESTVKSHLSSAFGKLGVASRNEAAALILDPSASVGLGILTIPSERITTSR